MAWGAIGRLQNPTFFLGPGHGCLGLAVCPVVHRDAEAFVRDVESQILQEQSGQQVMHRQQDHTLVGLP